MQQRLQDNRLLFSATDLCNFLDCTSRSDLDRRALNDSALKALRDDASEDAKLIQGKGFAHEARYLQVLKDQGPQVVEIEKGSPELMAERTIDAMKSGADVIFQATFIDVNARIGDQTIALLGHADFLCRVSVPSELGDYSYEVHDTKLAKTSKPKFLVQMIIYSELLARLQGVYPKQMHVVTGAAGNPVESHETISYRAVVRHALSELAIWADQPVREESFAPEPCSACDLCPWRSHCHNHWASTDHLSRVANIHKSQILRLNEAGISTRLALSQLPDDKQIPGIQPATLSRLKHQAELQVAAERDGKPIFVVLPTAVDRGFGRLPEPHPEDLYFDMEGNPLEEGGHLEYLFGLYHRSTGFKDFWALTHRDEKLAFEQFIDYVTQHLERHPGAHVYHYAAYEQTALKRLMTQYGTREAQVDHLLRQGLLIDLYQVVREGLRVSEPRYSIKNLEVFYQDKRSGEVTNAGASIVFFEQWKATQDAKFLKDIRDYNEDDVVSTMNLHRWLEKIRPTGISYRVRPEPAETEAPVRSEHEAELARLIDQLMAKVSHLPEEDPTYQVHQLLSYLLDFHRRSDKPAWWAMFERDDMGDEDLFDDPESLQGLLQVGDPVVDKRSRLWTYRFDPNQPTKVRAGVTMRLLGQEKSTNLSITQLDEARGELVIRIGQSIELPETMNLGPTGPIDNKVMQKSLHRLVTTYLETGVLPPAIKTLLYREPPLISGRELGTPILDHMPPRVVEVTDRVAALDNSLLFIQGPPGTGKTFTGSNVIVGLIQRGLRVGVMSNSHHAINNLLKAVESRAKAGGVVFRGAKKCTKNQPETLFEGECIVSIPDNERMVDREDYQLVAGTAWLFSREEMVGAVDVLFVDEAGQVSLANLLACMPSASSVVLLGDQMQLAQPIQGSHPGLSGVSGLDYLLDGAQTIAPDRGIFLSETWRMAPPITTFISDLVYERRLISEPLNAKQEIHWPTAAAPRRAQGIETHPVIHRGNAQSSLEEARALHAVYEDLLASSWTNRSGDVLPITMDDILVVAPYNLQVRLLQKVLPHGARVGTVDKFQGQEAAAVLISMATSSPDDLPRDIEFLFSTQRLNVAITRGRAYVGFFFSPDLLKVRANTIESMALVNTVISLSMQ